MEYASIEFSAHAIQRMFERLIDTDAIVNAVSEGEIIAEYEDDIPYPSFLLLYTYEGKPLHVVAGVNSESGTVCIITVYVPDQDLWTHDYKTRKRP